MSKNKDSVQSTMSGNFPVQLPPPAGSVVDKNVCPYFAHPREHGPDGEPEVFFTGVRGNNYHGKVESAAAKIHSTMGDKS